MKNAQWMIENHMDFADIRIAVDPNSVPTENFDRTKHYMGCLIKWKDIDLVEYESEDNNHDFYLQGLITLITWLDKEHKEVLTDEERWVLSESIKPYKSRVISIHKTYSNLENHISYISIRYKTTKEDQPDMTGLDDAQVYIVKSSEGLQFSGMIPGTDYSIEELGLNW